LSNIAFDVIGAVLAASAGVVPISAKAIAAPPRKCLVIMDPECCLMPCWFPVIMADASNGRFKT
jgi:hypothetical protein